MSSTHQPVDLKAVVEPPPTREDLPGILGEIADHVGLDTARIILKEHGGTRFFVPRKMRVLHKLANLLGFEQASRLAKEFGGETLTIPRGAAIIRKRRNAEIIRRYDAGESVRDLARAKELSERQIYEILGRTG